MKLHCTRKFLSLKTPSRYTKASKSLTFKSVLHIIEHCGSGGAGKASYRLHESLINRKHSDNQIASSIFTTHSAIYNEYIHTPNSKLTKLWLKFQPSIAPLILSQFPTSNTTIRTLAWPQTYGKRYLTRIFKSHDIIHVHWLGNSSLTINQLGFFSSHKPVVWTLHDQWPFLGTEHYRKIGHNEADLELNCNNHKDSIIDTYTASLKRNSWKNRLYYISPSNWMKESALSHGLISPTQIAVIPNPINTDFWKPLPKNIARTALEIPQDKKILLFGATGGSSDPRKGFDLLKKSLSILYKIYEDNHLKNVAILLYGSSSGTTETDSLPFPVYNLGVISDDRLLRLAYSSADIFLLPSRLDNLPTTAVEAHSCGLPVVAFDVGGVSDIVDSGQTGFLVEPYTCTEFAQKIYCLLNDPGLREAFSLSSRQKAVDDWSYSRISDMHLCVYDKFYKDFTSSQHR